MIEPLEGRVLFSAIDTSGVALFDASGNPASINRHMAVWFLVHGNNMSKDLMTDMATAVQDQLPANQWQVLIVDWSQLAAAPTNGAKNGEAVGDRLASMITTARLPTSRVNMIGFSMGGTVINRTAIDLKTRTTQVNCMVGIDAAIGRYDPAVLAQDSNYSIAFGGDDRYGGETGTLSADDAVLLTGLSASDLDRHADTFSVVTTIWQRDANILSSGGDGVSTLFSIPSILQGSPLPWRHNVFGDGYEASMACGEQPGLPNDLGPLSLAYVNTRGHKQFLT